MNRFLFIGCGDGLGDPHIGPLMQKARELLAARKTDQARDQEHFILVRGGELQRLIDNPLPGTISPVAYGTEFSDLTGFLGRLRGGLELGVSQNPRDYQPVGITASAATSPRPSGRTNSADRPTAKSVSAEDEVAPVTPLSRQVLADRQMQEALAAVRRAARAMDRVAACVVLRTGMTTWDPVSRLALHEHLAELAAGPDGPAARLRKLLRKARKAVVAAARAVRTVAALAEPGSTPAATQTAAATLQALTAELDGRVTLMYDDLAQRATNSSSRYRLLLPVMAEAQDEAADACHEAAELAQLLNPRSPSGDVRPATGQGDAGQPDAKMTDPADPDPRAQPSAKAEIPSAPVTFTGMDTRLVQPTFAAAAGPGTDKELHDAKAVPVPSILAEGNVIVAMVEGESMAVDDIHSGYYLVVDPHRPIDPGEIAVFEKEGPGTRERFVKRVSASENGATYLSSNPSYPGGKFSAADNAHLIGKVIAIIRTIS